MPQTTFVDDRSGIVSSWRAAVFTDEYKDPRDYDFSLPWDSVENLARARQFDLALSCACNRPTHGTLITPYLAVLGRDGSWLRHAQAVEPNVFLPIIIEWPQSDVGFFEPRDIDVDSVISALDRCGQESYSRHWSTHERGYGVFHYIRPDGNAIAVRSAADRKELRDQLTAAVTAGRDSQK
jgi:hypothetical protein